MASQIHGWLPWRQAFREQHKVLSLQEGTQQLPQALKNFMALQVLSTGLNEVVIYADPKQIF